MPLPITRTQIEESLAILITHLQESGTVPHDSYFVERWLREHSASIVDQMEIDGTVHGKLWSLPCGKEEAHGGHYWSNYEAEWNCDGIKAHHNTAIGGRHDGEPAMYGQIDVSQFTGGTK